ncbi:ABC transporter ATP-binding protein [Aliihoeflea sp. 40Bstr573]|uniref:ABC transporter ATP-binding protein n=1 Tax=Aliihoeflea sp. 40Bstr573 TaxID=2696467 RepID=UPI0020949C40|nr:ABC transporter ATP-binding protein [Aliihoeflea sp. 40Bstr573]MCO6388783.1 ATP-binding cassette domain-containing protein [Aliihoeflea sp. 40Bstr573]
MDSMLLDIEKLNVTIDTAAGPLKAVQNVSLRVAKGETFCIVGESGCGKSITALSLMGLMPKRAKRRAERMMFDGTDMTTLGESGMRRLRGNRISMIFQEPMTSLNPVFTIGQQLTDVMRAHSRVSLAEARERAAFLLNKVGITNARERLGQFPHELSGGLRQRVMIAMALMCSPDLMIADEPTTALDVTIQAELLRLLRDLQQEFEMGLVLITHDLGIVSRIADRIAVMYAGQIVEDGTADEIFGNPLHPYTQGLIACIPSPDHPRMQHLPSIPGTVPPLIGGLKGCHFRERCPYAMPSCMEEIELKGHEAAHRYRCILPAQTSAAHAKMAQGEQVHA